MAVPQRKKAYAQAPDSGVGYVTNWMGQVIAAHPNVSPCRTLARKINSMLGFAAHCQTVDSLALQAAVAAYFP